MSPITLGLATTLAAGILGALTWGYTDLRSLVKEQAQQQQQQVREQAQQQQQQARELALQQQQQLQVLYDLKADVKYYIGQTVTLKEEVQR
jgi:hypothetical protein